MRRNDSRRGNYSMFMGVFATSILGFGALGVDISYIAMANNQAQAVADAASHAALVALRHSDAAGLSGRVLDGKAAAQHVVNVNEVGLGERGHLASVKFGIFNPNTGNFSPDSQPYNAAYAEVDRKGSDALQLLLAPIIGANEADVLQSGVTAANPREIVVVVDRSCSMQSPEGYQGWEGVRDALRVFSEYMVEHQVPLDQLGVTYFSSSGGTWEPLTPVYGNEPAILAKWADWGYCNRNGGWAPADATDWEKRFACNGSTDQRDGVVPAHNMLNASTNPYAFKAMIVISDGNPNPSDLDDDFLNATQSAWDDDIHVWTVGFGASINQGLMANAAKGVGRYHHSPDAEGLVDVMLDIARSIPVAVVE